MKRIAMTTSTTTFSMTDLTTSSTTPNIGDGGMGAHTSVLFAECLEALAVTASDVVVDATVGGAGHFAALASALGNEGTLVGIDADADAIARGREATKESVARVELVEDNFRNLGTILDMLQLPQIDKSLFDLGWSGFQLTRGRGFSFKVDEPLYMTYGDPHAAGTVTAEDIVNGYGEEELANLIYELGEERFSRGIAGSIVNARRRTRITTTGALVHAIEAGVPVFYKKGKIHPATKTFQALRIAVNDEYGAIREGVESAIARTREGGRIAVITFHSGEDRIVKQLFRDAAKQGLGGLYTKKPIAPTREELLQNPRARSSKLRVFVRGPA